MTLFLASFSGAALFALALWLCRNLIITRLTRSVQHEFDGKLERLKADFRASENEIATLRAGAMAGLAGRQALVDKRRLEAVDQLWAGVLALAPARIATIAMTTINFEVAAAEIEKHPQARELFATFAVDPAKLSTGDAQKARPFVSPLAWALFSAFSSIHGFAVMQLHMLKAGLAKPEFLNPESIVKLIKLALPHQSEYVDKHGYITGFFLLEELESELLKEIRRMLSGEDTDKATVERAAAIVHAAEKVREAKPFAQFKTLTTVIQAS